MDLFYKFLANINCQAEKPKPPWFLIYYYCLIYYTTVQYIIISTKRGYRVDGKWDEKEDRDKSMMYAYMHHNCCSQQVHALDPSLHYQFIHISVSQVHRIFLNPGRYIWA